MPTENQDDRPWPPTPGTGHQAPLPPSPPRPARWLRALLAAARGAAVGAGTVLAALSIVFYFLNNARGPLSLAGAVVAAAQGVFLLGGGFWGMVIGLVVWLIRDARRRVPK